jgi:propanol-preferring alcohol dehydrogenase
MLLKVAVASLCHTDSMVNAGKFPTKLPCTASHEGAGTVKAVGSEVVNFKIGDRVMAGLPKNPCGKCFNCKGPNDWRQYCEHVEGHIGVFIDGAFAEYLVVDARTSAHVPDSMSFKSAAPLACAGCTIYRSIIVSEVKKGGWLAIVGSGGGLGHLGLQMAKAMGINVIGVDARDEGIELSKKVGCQHVFDARKGKAAVAKEVQALTEGLGVEAAINTSEHETAAPLSCAITRIHGRMVQVAQPDMVCIPFPELIFRDIRIVGTMISGQEQAQDMLNLVAENKIQVEVNVFHGLKEVPRMVDLSHSGKMKGKAVCVVDEKAIEEEKGKVAS